MAWRRFPKARPSRAAKRAPNPYRRQTHQFQDSGQRDWDGMELCEGCTWRRNHVVHDVKVPVEASEVDARKLGEAETGD